ncbi:metallophosphoesterase [Sedimentibacter sp. zth1]|uniref:metallophosphoesterase n=1 Tax=Sedimentibacter sp. zth1 TaxID=2816908 RepID=UPI001A9229AC|nr:metallophosphoesterase [Sedimentibacter sp. zth1]QSX05143.1 metallophosphoesterase [Sedimentibacter sp. zth1]
MKKLFKFLVTVISLAILVYTYSRYIEPKFIKINKQIVSSTYVSNALLGKKVVQFSDTHISEYFGIEELRNIVNKINLLNPDIILFTGDLIDNYNKYNIEPTEISNVLSKLNATYGKFCVYGNHDYGGGAVSIYKEIMNDAGFYLLINNTIKLDELNLTITGLDDAIFGYPNLDSLHKYIEENNYNIIICHEPDIIDNIENYNYDIAIAGHSHGEQINIPFLDDYILPPLAKNYVRGMYNLNTPRNGKIYVNKGIGTTKYPLRLFARPEITIFEFTE